MTQKQISKKRRGEHHNKDNKNYRKTYWPYIVVISLSVGLISLVLTFSKAQSPDNLSTTGSAGEVLSYEINISSGGLLVNTNNQRQAVGIQNLTVNSSLSQAAQAKANDMVIHDYWSHNTPDGQTPWTFINSAGYQYVKSGENLAYGFSTDYETIVGWMNSPAHKQAMLDPDYAEVGFGIANSKNFVSNGPQTIIVAIYGNPLTPTITNQQASDNKPKTLNTSSLNTSDKEQYNSQLTNYNESKPIEITRIQRLTKGKAPWATAALTMITIAVGVLWATRHAHNLKRKIKQGEKFIQHHPAIDVSVVALIVLTIVLTKVIGIIL